MNVEGSRDRTPLDLAIGFQHSEVTKLLIDNAGHKNENNNNMIKLNDRSTDRLHEFVHIYDQFSFWQVMEQAVM